MCDIYKVFKHRLGAVFLSQFARRLIFSSLDNCFALDRQSKLKGEATLIADFMYM